MGSLRRAIEAAGFQTWSRGYPSRKLSVVEAARIVAKQIRDEVGDGPVLAVTHSLGGILVRHMGSLVAWRGLVMLAPPNGGSRVALRYHAHPLYRWFYGPAGSDICDPSAWPPPPTPFAVIAGTKSSSLGNPTSWFTHSLRLFGPDEPNDGTLLVDETRHPAMAAFATVDASHTWIMNHPETHRLVVEFLRRGDFTASAARVA